MLTDIQKSNIKSFLEDDFDLVVKSIRSDKYEEYGYVHLEHHYKILCEFNDKKITLSLVKNDDNDKYKVWANVDNYLFVPKFASFLANHERYQKISLLKELVTYSLFSIKNYITTCFLAESTFIKKEKHVASFEVMTMFQFAEGDHNIHNILAGVTKFSKNEVNFKDKFASSYYREPRVRPVNHVDFNISFKNKNDNMKMIQDVLFANYIRYMNMIRKFNFEFDNISEIVQLDHVEAAYRINANLSLKEMVEI